MHIFASDLVVCTKSVALVARRVCSGAAGSAGFAIMADTQRPQADKRIVLHFATSYLTQWGKM